MASPNLMTTTLADLMATIPEDHVIDSGELLFSQRDLMSTQVELITIQIDHTMTSQIDHTMTSQVDHIKTMQLGFNMATQIDIILPIQREFFLTTQG